MFYNNLRAPWWSQGPKPLPMSLIGFLALVTALCDRVSNPPPFRFKKKTKKKQTVPLLFCPLSFSQRSHNVTAY